LRDLKLVDIFLAKTESEVAEICLCYFIFWFCL